VVITVGKTLRERRAFQRRIETVKKSPGTLEGKFAGRLIRRVEERRRNRLRYSAYAAAAPTHFMRRH
jgi:hypothetical protein